jgi:Peptidase family M41/LAGLIDADG-like domain
VTFNDWTSTECTSDHLWQLEALDPRMPARTFTLGEVLERGLRWSPRGSRFYLPKLKAVEFAPRQPGALDPYLVGLLLGDGGFTDTTPDFCTADAENLAAVAELVPTGVALVQHGPRNWRLSGGSRTGVPRSQPNPVTDELRRFGLWGVDGDGKFVPDAYKLGSMSDRLAVLQGLMDSDGSCDFRRGTGATFYSNSARLADDVAFIVRSLGGSARAKAKRDGWRVAIDLPESLTPFRLPRKAEAHRTSRRPFRKRIVGVEPLGPKQVQCVTVANDDGLYVTDGFTVTHNSPAMIEQVCSMALTYAHSEGRERFDYEDIFEAMTTIESGTAINIEYAPEETKAVAIHEAGHAAASHVYMKDAQSTRLSIRMRGAALGHHQTVEQVERFSRWRSEQVAMLIWGLGAMAAERVFYGENSTGVGGDIATATALAAYMVGSSGMGPEAVDVDGTLEQEERAKIMKRFETIGTQIMSRTAGGGAFAHDPIASVLSDRDKRAAAAQIIGQAYVTAYNLMLHNREAIEHIADEVVARREIYGDELLELLDGSKLKAPKVDLLEEASWPML